MNEDALSFTKIKINSDLLDEIWGLDPRQLDYVDGAVLSSYALALSQYLVYFTYQKNLTRAEQYRLNKNIDRQIALILASDRVDLKKIKTKTDIKEYLISIDTNLMDMQSKLDGIYKELLQVEGIDKVMSELIATIKRELTRRENELYQVRQERRN